MSSLKSSMEPDKAASIMYVDEGYTEGLDCNQPQILLTLILTLHHTTENNINFIL